MVRVKDVYEMLQIIKGTLVTTKYTITSIFPINGAWYMKQMMPCLVQAQAFIRGNYI